MIYAQKPALDTITVSNVTKDTLLVPKVYHVFNAQFQIVYHVPKIIIYVMNVYLVLNLQKILPLVKIVKEIVMTKKKKSVKMENIMTLEIVWIVFLPVKIAKILMNVLLVFQVII